MAQATEALHIDKGLHLDKNSRRSLLAAKLWAFSAVPPSFGSKGPYQATVMARVGGMHTFFYGDQLQLPMWGESQLKTHI